MREWPGFRKPRLIPWRTAGAVEDGVTKYGNTLVLRGQRDGPQVNVFRFQNKKRCRGAPRATRANVTRMGHHDLAGYWSRRVLTGSSRAAR